MTQLTVENVSYSYRTKYQTVYAVKEVSCAMEPGVFYALIGKSGSGKTTLLSLLAGLETPDSGAILVNGEDLKGMDVDLYRRKTASVIYQNYNLFPLMTVQENVMYPLLLGGMKKAEAAREAQETLARVGLDSSYWKRLPAMLSGGEQQRVAIARALINAPAVLLADEPSGNLDSVNREEIHRLFFDLRERLGQTIVVVTHDDHLASMADRRIVMRDGLIINE